MTESSVVEEQYRSFSKRARARRTSIREEIIASGVKAEANASRREAIASSDTSPDDRRDSLIRCGRWEDPRGQGCKLNSRCEPMDPEMNTGRNLRHQASLSWSVLHLAAFAATRRQRGRRRLVSREYVNFARSGRSWKHRSSEIGANGLCRLVYTSVSSTCRDVPRQDSWQSREQERDSGIAEA
jgi:hypothetical protein